MVAFALALPMTTALATNQTGFTVDDAHMHVVKKYGPIPGEDPSAGLQGLQDPSLMQCQTLPQYDAIPIILKVSHDATVKETIKTEFDATAMDDVDVYFYDSKGNEISRSASSAEPETLNLAGLPDGEYWLCAVNFNGVNTGITIDFEATRLDLYHYTPPPATPFPTTGSKTPSPPPTSTPPAVITNPDATPAITPEVVATPGPNGPVTGQNLDALSGSQQASAHKNGHSALSLALGAATVLLALSGAGVVIVRIRRDTTP